MIFIWGTWRVGAQEGLRGLSYKKGLGKVAVSLAGAPSPGPDPAWALVESTSEFVKC